MILTLTKMDVAYAQLRAAVQMYNKRNMVAAITLSGAAEDVLERIATEQSSNNARMQEKELLDQVSVAFKKPKVSTAKLKSKTNDVKNWIKHNDKDHADSKEADFPILAENGILAALRNWELITGGLPKDRIIKQFWNKISL